jgi:hypothetical protein
MDMKFNGITGKVQEKRFYCCTAGKATLIDGGI